MKINDKQVFVKQTISLTNLTSKVSKLMKEFPETVIALKGEFYVELNGFFPLTDCKIAVGEQPACVDIPKIIRHGIYTAVFNNSRIPNLFKDADSRSIEVTDFEIIQLVIYGNSKIGIAKSGECGIDYIIINKDFKL